MLEGVPGLAKTLLISTLARCLNLSFSRIQFTPDLMPADITGTDIIDENRATGQRVGVKPAGGIRTAKDAIAYLVLVAETVGEEWLQPHLFRYGASSLLNDVLRQRQKLRTGHYTGADYVTID